MTYIALLVLLLAVVVYRHHQNPYRHTTLYRCVEDGENSALYRYSYRYHSFAGGFTVDLFKRVTCVPGEKYASATSDWFDPWSGYSGKMLAHFKRVPHQEAQRLLAIQLPVTREVAHQISKAKRNGAVEPNRGFSAA